MKSFLRQHPAGGPCRGRAISSSVVTDTQYSIRTAAEVARMDCVTRETAGEGRNKSGVAVAAVAAGGPLGGDRAGGQGDGCVGEGCGVGASVAARQGEAKEDL